MDKIQNEILTSSPAVVDGKSKTLDINKLNLDEDEYLEETSFKNTIQSINEKDNVNYLRESNQIQNFETLKRNKYENTQNSEILFQDTDNNYDESSTKLLDSIKSSLDYFKKTVEIGMKNNDKVSIIKMTKENYEKMKLDYENVLIENQRLKEKIIKLKETSPRSNISITDNVNISRFMDSLMYLQNKNEELEKENKLLKSENDEIAKKLKIEKTKRLNAYDPHVKKLSSNKSQSTLPYHNQNKMKQDQMEILLKEQITCMKKMLFIVQDGKENMSSQRIRTQNNYEEESDADSNIHFEESFNVTNLSNSGEYTPDVDVM